MELFDAIHSRKSVAIVKPDPLPKVMVEKLIAAGSAAPNHFKIRPWRFTVLQGEELARFGEAHVRSLLRKNPEANTDLIESERKKGSRAPLVISVVSTKPVEVREKDIENISAASAACQNILLAAHSMGLGAIWRTGQYAQDEVIKEFLGVSDVQHLIGVLYIGVAVEHNITPVERPSFEDRTIWRY